MKLRWMKRRWTLRHIWYRTRLPIRRRRWERTRRELAKIFRKSPTARLSCGPALVFGDFSGNTGISRGTIYDIELLREKHSDITLIDISEYLSGKEIAETIFEPFQNVYLFCQPDVYQHALGLASTEALKDAYRVARWVWETHQLPTSWSFAADIVHEVWAPSNFCGSVFARSLNIPVRVVPYPVKAPKGTIRDIRARFGIDETVFLGLTIMDIRSCPERKNPWAHVLAWQAAFGTNQRTILICKLKTSKRTNLVVEELKDLIGSNHNILVITEDLSDIDLASLQIACDVYLSLHRSEGFGLTIYEALLCGKITLATDWSANHDYGPLFPNYRGIRYRLVPYRDWTNHYESGNFCWAQADIEHAASELRIAYQNFAAAQGKLPVG